MTRRVPRHELAARLARFRACMDDLDPEWALAAVMGKVNLYYLTGTMQNGALFVPRDGDPAFYVRRSLERALLESEFPTILPMKGFREPAERFARPGTPLHVEQDVVTLTHAARFGKYFPGSEVRGLDRALCLARAVKTPFELDRMRRAGDIHREVLESVVPAVLREGMTEAELGTEILRAMLERGHHGVARVAMFDTELFLGQVCFGENSLHPNPFDGPGGVLGLSPAVPLFGSRERTLRRDELVFVDVGCGVDGYHTDKTMVYAFGSIPPEAATAHARCVEIRDRAAERLRPGNVPAEIYDEAVAGLDAEFLGRFMACGGDAVRFLGHGVGLVIDEFPVIAEGFDTPLEAGMTVALEPKCAVLGVGMVGTEDTFLVTPQGGISLTGTSPGLLPV